LGAQVRRDSVVVQRRLSAAPSVSADTAHDAARAAEAETQMSLWQGIKTYPKAIGWSALLSTAIVSTYTNGQKDNSIHVVATCGLT
jgi:SP family general alpha glucoside:H+ symporter-like MFS transporter